MYYHKSQLLLIALSTSFIIMMPACKKPINADKGNKEEQPSATTTTGNAEKTFSGKIEKLSFEEAKIAHDYYKSTGQTIQLIKTLERMIALSTDHEVINELIIELADLKFSVEQFAEAEMLYMQHSVLYPGSPQIDYIKAQEIESAFRQILDFSRDQTKTKAVIQLAEKFLKRFPTNTRYYKRIQSIEQECYHILLTSELNHVDFYLQKHAYTDSPVTLKAAKQRLIYIKETILPHIDQQKTQSIIEEIEEQLEKPEEPKLTSDSLTQFVQKIRTLTTDFQGQAPSTTTKHARDRF